MKDLRTIKEIKRDVIFRQKKLKLAMSEIETIESDEQFANSDIKIALLTLQSIFECGLEKMRELEQQMGALEKIEE